MRFFILLIFTVLSGLAFGQGASIQLEPIIGDDDTGKSLQGATIEVYKGGVKVASGVSGNRGKVNPIELDICIGCTYTIKVLKAGYVTKTFLIDGHTDYPEELEPGVRPLKFEVDIFQSVEGIDFSFLDREPMVEFQLDAYGSLEYDQKKINVMKKKIEDLKKRMEEKKKELEKEEAEREKREADFMEYVKAGDAAVGTQDYEKAIGQYNLALEIKPDDQPTQDKLENAKIKLEEQRSREAEEKAFGEKMAEAKKAYGNDDLVAALGLYKEAKDLKPDEQLPKDRIAEIEKKLAEQKQSEEAFNKFVAEGDNAVGSENYDTAIEKYQAALDLKKDSGVQTKLDDAKKKKADAEGAAAAEKAKRDEYESLITRADDLFSKEDLEEAKTNYRKASDLYPDEAKPKDRIAEIDKKLEALAAERDAAEKLEADYNKAIAEGKEKFNQRSWEDAKAKYEEALRLKPGDPEAQKQIAAIENEIENEADAAKLDAEYEAAMTAAQTLFDQEKYEEARSKYQEASGIKSNEQAPKDKISEIDGILADAADAAKKEQEYNDFMTKGNAANDRADYAEALDQFQKALDTKPGDTEAKSKIDGINALIEADKKAAEDQAKFDQYVKDAEQAFNASNYDQAKLNYNNALDIKSDDGIKAKIAEIDRLIAENQSAAETQAKYDAAMTEADELYAQGDLKGAYEKYKAAVSIKDEQRPKDQMTLIDAELKKQADEQAEEERFTKLKEEGEAAYNAEKYTEAIAKYKEAISVRPDPAISQKIAEINTKLAEESQNAETRNRYDAKMEEAKKAFDESNWEAARSLYQEAQRILPNETLPQEQIDEIQRRIAEESAAEVEAEYKEIIAKADGQFDQKEFDQAEIYYKQAKNLKGTDPYPQERLDEIARIRRESADAEANARELEERYTAAIKDGEQNANAENWTAALASFKEALSVKPQDAYALNKIAEIETRMGDAAAQKAKDDEYNKYVNEADDLFNNQEYIEAIKSYEKAIEVKPAIQYPKDQIATARGFINEETQNEEEAAYQKILTVAQKKFDEENYEKALDLYGRAVKMRPTDPLPSARIDEINQIINKANENDALEKEYKALIDKADAAYEKGDFMNARENYVAAYNMFNREYPEAQINKCDEALKEDQMSNENKQYNKIIAKADEYFGTKEYEKSKKYYNRAIGLKPSDQYPKDKLKEIEGILSGNNVAQSKTNMRDWGDPNRSVNSIDIDAMLADAEAQRKFEVTQDVEDQTTEANEAEKEKDTDQTDYNFETKRTVEEMDIDLERADFEANEERKASVFVVEEMQSDLIDVDVERGIDNNNDVQRQLQVVENINTEIDKQDDENDVPREEFIMDVEEIHQDVIQEENRVSTDQENETFDQRRYVEQYNENRIEDDPNMDADRKSTEVYVEDFEIQIINETNEGSWDQEDATMQIKEDTEELIDEQIASNAESDVPRVLSEDGIEKERLDAISIERNNRNDQYDVTVEQKEYAESIRTEIELEEIGNDIPRQEMEEFVEDQTVDNLSYEDELVIEQTDEMYDVDAYTESIEIKMKQDETENDLNREGYEETVDKIKTEEEQYIDNKDSDNRNGSFETVDYLEGEENQVRQEGQVYDEQANERIDETENSVEEMNEENREESEENRVKVESTEDYVESLRDIDVSEVDEKMKNTLGEQFPEGVTEEIFTINDEDGLMVSYVVRRVVVRNGVGNVFEKVQTKFGTTSYTMNGQGITEYDWQDQTEAADLVRN